MDERVEKHMHANHAFARQRGLTHEDIAELESTYLLLMNVLDFPELQDDPVARVKELEFELQRLWKFPQDAKFHRYQLYIKGCTCPRMDNAELFGITEDRYATSDCPWHWKGEK